MRTFARICALLAVIGLANVAWGVQPVPAKSTPKPKAKITSVRGDLVKVDGSHVIVKTKQKQITLTAGSRTAITKAGKTAKLSDLKKGDKVLVTMSGSKVQKITVQKALPRPAASHVVASTGGHGTSTATAAHSGSRSGLHDANK